jgi:4-alpha-glucanotransferase
MDTVNWREWGIEPGYLDALERWQTSPVKSLELVRQAMTNRPPPSGPTYRDVWVIGHGETRAIREPSQLRLEDGTVEPSGAYLRRDLPFGYHELESDESGERTRIVVTPGQCWLPDDLSTWGWAVQLYALRSKKSWGMGDLGDLRALARWSSARLGAGMMLVNPFHAPLPTLPQQPSPYYPSSRLYRNPLYLRIEEVPGARERVRELAHLANAGRSLSGTSRIDRDATFALKIRALEAIFARFKGSKSFDAYAAREAPFLESYATFSVLAEVHGNDRRAWPKVFSRPEGEGLRRFRQKHARRVRFHAWIQWLLDEQLKRAGREIPLVGDLAVGADPGGADAWIWQDLFAPGMDVGAPPDEFNTLGQNWGLKPFDPARLRLVGYEPIVRIVRSAMRHMGGIRLDHVMGLFRLFWIPQAKKPKDGAYVRYPALDLLGIVALESMRAKAVVVGEDLGTVEDEVRSELAHRKMMSYRVLWFEEGTPEEYPAQALAAVTTHDLPTIAGLWSGSDVARQRALNLAPNEKGTRAQRRALAKMTGVKPGAPIDQVILKTHEALARAPSVLLAPTLDDALGVADRPNMPGTIDEYPCWCLPLPKLLEEIVVDPRLPRIAKALAARRGRKAGNLTAGNVTATSAKPRRSPRAKTRAKRKG